MPESDPNPLDAFRSDAGAPLRPLPAAEVRRRGDRFRRRRTALVAAGAVAAVIAIAVPLAVVNAGTDRTAPPIADTPSPRPADPTQDAAEDSSSTATPQVGDIPEDFPLFAGWPEQPGEAEQPGRIGPSRSLELTIDPDLCGAPFPVPAYRDHLEAAFTNVEDGRERVLYSFDDAAQAIDFVTEAVRAYEGCPTQTADQFGRFNEARQTSIGGQSYAFVTTRTFDGFPAIGLKVTQVVRLGRAVLVDTTESEGGVSAEPEREIRAQITRQEGALSPILRAMCRFTAAGC